MQPQPTGLCDVDSTTGTYVNDERIQAAPLEHLSEFGVGPAPLPVTVLPKCKIVTTYNSRCNHDLI